LLKSKSDFDPELSHTELSKMSNRSAAHGHMYANGSPLKNSSNMYTSSLANYNELKNLASGMQQAHTSMPSHFSNFKPQVNPSINSEISEEPMRQEDMKRGYNNPSSENYPTRQEGIGLKRAFKTDTFGNNSKKRSGTMDEHDEYEDDIEEDDEDL